MDEMNIGGGLGGAISLTGGYARNPFAPVVSNEAFVDVAMAVTCRPKLLLLDEPTSGVAAEEKFPLMDVIMRSV